MTATFFEYLGWVSLSANLKASFNKTLLDAEQHRHGTVEIEHLLFALVDDPEAAITLTQMGINRDELRDNIADHLDAIPAGPKINPQKLQPARCLKKLMAKASDQADNQHDDHIDGGDVIRALDGFKMSNGTLDFLDALQNEKGAKQADKHQTRSRAHKSTRHDHLPPNAGDETVENTTPTPPSPPLPSDEFGFDADPIKASIKAIMARRADAEKILFECEWYHLFKSLNLIDEVLEGEEQIQRARLLARAEKELAERPRCRKAFLYVRHLDKELARLKGIVDIDWVGEITPDQAVRELDRLRSLPQSETVIAKSADRSSELDEHLFDVKIQESEVLALEQKLLRLDETAGTSQERLKELEGHLETHDTHSKKRENVIGELERYLRSEMQMADARDQRIADLEKQLRDSRNISSSQIDKTNLLEHELKTFKEHAGNREMHISDLEAKLKAEKDTATFHEKQVSELNTMLTKEKSRAEAHSQQVEELQKTFDAEKLRAASQEQQVVTLEADLKSRMEQLQAREDHIKKLQERLLAKENHMAAREEQVKKLEADLLAHASLGDQHQQEIGTLRTQLGSLETRLQDQEAAYTVEKINLATTIEEMRREIEESESLIEIIHATGEPYRVKPDTQTDDEALATLISRRTIPVAAKRDDSEGSDS